MIPADRIAAFIERCSAGAYVEPASELHTELSRKIWEEKCKPLMQLSDGAWVLDLGCGSGHAMRMFSNEGLWATGLTCLAEEATSITSDGTLTCIVCDIHALGRRWHGEEFSLVWARHVLEHSPIPAFVLSEIQEIIKPGGFLYVEVPLSDTACKHEENKNHWSVLPKSGWQQLILRAGFTILESLSIKFETQAGSDEYAGFICQKKMVDNKSA